MQFDKLHVVAISRAVDSTLRDRLQRISNMENVGLVTVVSDSQDGIFCTSSESHWLAHSKLTGTPIIGLHSSPAQQLAFASPRTAGRVGVMRNVALNQCANRQLGRVLLIDDDIEFDNVNFRRAVEASECAGEAIVGVDIRGHDSRDTLTQIFCRAGLEVSGEPLPIRHRLLARTGDWEEVHYVSGGFLLIPSALTKRLKPFPCMYNETWVWCLFNRLLQRIPVVKSRATVEHLRESRLATSARLLILEQTGVLLARVLKRAQRKSFSTNTDIQRWFDGSMARNLCNELSPDVRLNQAIGVASPEQRAALDQQFRQLLGFGTQQVQQELRQADWHNAINSAMADYTNSLQ